MFRPIAVVAVVFWGFEAPSSQRNAGDKSHQAQRFSHPKMAGNQQAKRRKLLTNCQKMSKDAPEKLMDFVLQVLQVFWCDARAFKHEFQGWSPQKLQQLQASIGCSPSGSEKSLRLPSVWPRRPPLLSHIGKTADAISCASHTKLLRNVCDCQSPSFLTVTSVGSYQDVCECNLNSAIAIQSFSGWKRSNGHRLSVVEDIRRHSKILFGFRKGSAKNMPKPMQLLTRHTRQARPLIFLVSWANAQELVALSVMVTAQTVTLGSITLSSYSHGSTCQVAKVEFLQEAQHMPPMKAGLLVTVLFLRFGRFSGGGLVRHQRSADACSSRKVGQRDASGGDSGCNMARGQGFCRHSQTDQPGCFQAVKAVQSLLSSSSSLSHSQGNAWCERHKYHLPEQPSFFLVTGSYKMWFMLVKALRCSKPFCILLLIGMHSDKDAFVLATLDPAAFCTAAHKAVRVASNGMCIESCSVQTTLYTFAKKKK